MAAAPPPIPASVPNITPSDSSLVPRREFVKYIKTPSSFSILTFSASSQIRLYNFPTPVVSAVRRLLDRTRTVTGHKEDVLRNLVEFSVEGKPWTNPKSLPSEKLLLDIIAVLLHQGYEYRSTFDFGREQDDRAILAFSKPMATTPQSPPSSPALHSQHQRSSESSSSAAAHNPSHLVKHPFAISFPSATILHVISPPLASTPAILQSVRGSWPRGVVSEHKIAPDSYEFKLKGYKWYQEDTFAADSLGYILSLLASLDSHGFSLMASLVITNRSRVKDLWIFTGLADAASLESPGASTSEFQTEFKSRTSSDARHESLSPPPIAELRQGRSHGRSGSLGSRQSPGRSSSGRATLLRKPAPRAQLPVSVASSIGEEDGNADALPGAQPRPDGPVRDPLPSSVDSAVDMTGIGARQWQAAPAPAPEVPSPPEETSPTTTPAIFYQTSAPDHNPYFPDQPELSRGDVPEMVEHLAPPSQPSPRLHASPDPQPGLLTPTMAAEKTPPLLSPDVFRDSALSSGSAVSSEIPITWTGPSKDPASPESEQAKTPVLPGGWSSPGGEVPPPGADGDQGQEPAADISFRPRPQDLTPVRQEVQAASSFAVTQPPLGSARKSETGVLGQVPQHEPPSPPLPTRAGTEATPPPPSQGKLANATLPPNVNGEGWVFINVTGGPVPAPGSPSSPSKSAGHPPTDNHAHPGGAHSSSGIVPQLGGVLQSHDEPIPTSLTAAALQIVEKDNKSRGTALAVPSANGSGGSANARQLERKSSESRKRGRGVSEGPVRAADKQQQPSSPPPLSSPLRRIFSQSRAKDGAVRKSRSFEAEDTARTTRSRLDSVDSLPRQRVGLRERWRRRGVPEATTKTDRRMSVD